MVNLSTSVLEEIEGEIKESEAIVAKTTEAKQKIQTALKERPHASDVQSSPAEPPESTVNRPHLPKLTLQRFRGEITQWSSFWDPYKSAVYKNDSLSTIDKFNYLNSLLKGAAARTIQGLPLNETNYQPYSCCRSDMVNLSTY